MSATGEAVVTRREILERLRSKANRCGVIVYGDWPKALDTLEYLVTEMDKLIKEYRCFPGHTESTQLKLQYIGACSLLARIGGRELDTHDRDLIKCCLDDCARISENLEVVRVSGPVGWSLEPKR